MKSVNLEMGGDIQYILLPMIFESVSDKKQYLILIDKKNDLRFDKMMCGQKYIRSKHPWELETGHKYLYAMDKLDCYSKEDCDVIVSYQLFTTSINDGEFMPLDRIIQENVWKRRVYNDKVGCYELAGEEKIIFILANAILNKKVLNIKDKDEIEKLLLNGIDYKILNEEMSVVFFKYTNRLINMLISREYDDIVQHYYTFVDY